MSVQQEESPREEKTKFEPLNDAQIEYAHELLEELHPIEDTPICAAFPWLGVFTSCGVPNVPKRRSEIEAEAENHALDSENNAPLLKKKTTIIINGKEVEKKKRKKKKNNIANQKKLEERPIASLGFGIVAYMDILWTLIISFFFFSILLLPTMSYYNAGTGYKSLNENLSQYELGTLGNMGYSSVQCASIPLQIGSLNMQCPYGSIGEMYDSGVNLSDVTASNCASNSDIDQCKPDSSTFKDAVASSIGQETFLLEFSNWETLYTQPLTKTGCFKANTSRLFVQYTCVQSKESQAEKYNQMCLVVATGILIAFLFTITIRLLYQGGKMEQIDWDMTTITAGDYTVELEINLEQYEQWERNTYEVQGGPRDQGISPALAYKTEMKAEIERIIDEYEAANEREDRDYDDQGKKIKKRQKAQDAPYQTKIADIVFSFKNKELILALRARGAKIARNDFKGMRVEDEKISAMLADDDKRDMLTTPTSAFITFESDDSKLYALSGEIENKCIMGMNFEFQNASEPTDIIWENRQFSTSDYFIRQLIAMTIVCVLLFLSFLVIYAISDYSAKMAAVFPPADCKGIKASYTGDLFEQYAKDDYNFITTHKEVQSLGTLQCWCQQEKKDHPDTYMSDSYGQEDGIPICLEYQERVNSVYNWTSSLSYLLIGINYILRTVCIMLVNWIGYPTETGKLSNTTSVTFYVQYFNSAFLLLLVNANLSEQPFTLGLTGGSMGDFNSTWFRTVGNVLIGAMFFNMYYPIIEAVLYYFIRWQGRCRDRGCRCKGTGTKITTKQTSIQGYLDMYSGPIYYMHFKYASIMTITFITFIYGFGMPILFPVASVSFLVLYIVEKLLLFYGYRLPPMYDERLSQAVLRKLQMAPLLYLAVGYWMASNQQLLSNAHLEHMTSTKDVKLTTHTYGSVLTGDGWAGIKWPMLLAFFFLIIIYFFGSKLEKCIDSCCGNFAIGDIELNETIDTYWASLDDGDRKWSIREEENARNLRTSMILTDSQFDRLNSFKKTTGKTLQGVHSYDILANPLYLDDFQYVTAAEDNRGDMIIDDDEDEENDAAQSDLVRCMLNLAYMHENEAKNFSFSPAGLRDTSEVTKGYSNQIM